MRSDLPDADHDPSTLAHTVQRRDGQPVMGVRRPWGTADTPVRCVPKVASPSGGKCHPGRTGPRSPTRRDGRRRRLPRALPRAFPPGDSSCMPAATSFLSPLTPGRFPSPPCGRDRTGCRHARGARRRRCGGRLSRRLRRLPPALSVPCGRVSSARGSRADARAESGDGSF